MDKFKKFNGSWHMIFAMLTFMLLAGTFILPAAEKQEHGFLGVSVQSLGSDEKEELGIKNGVEVSAVEKESAALKAGIKEKDIIQLLNGEKIRNAQDLADSIGELTPGTVVKIGLWRDGKVLEVTATLGKPKAEKKIGWNRKRLPRIIRSGAYLGIVLQEMNSDLAPYFNVKAGEGVLIASVEKDTAAEKAGLKAGDVIIKLGEKTVNDAGDIHEVLADLKKGETIAIDIVRHGKKAKIKAEPDFNRCKRIIRIFKGGKDKNIECPEIPDMDSEIPGIGIEIPPLPDLSHVEESLHRVHEKLGRMKVKIEKRLEKICENFWI